MHILHIFFRKKALCTWWPQCWSFEKRVNFAKCVIKSEKTETCNIEILQKGEIYQFCVQWTHSMARANLNKSKKVLTNTTAASKYMPRRTRISINLNTPFQTSVHKISRLWIIPHTLKSSVHILSHFLWFSDSNNPTNHLIENPVKCETRRNRIMVGFKDSTNPPIREFSAECREIKSTNWDMVLFEKSICSLEMKPRTWNCIANLKKDKDETKDVVISNSRFALRTELKKQICIQRKINFQVQFVEKVWWAKNCIKWACKKQGN